MLKNSKGPKSIKWSLCEVFEGRLTNETFSEFIALRNSILQSFANGSEELLEGSAVALLANGHETLSYISIDFSQPNFHGA